MPSSLPSPSSPSSSTPCDLGHSCAHTAPLATPPKSGERKDSMKLNPWYERVVLPNTPFLAIHANEQSKRWSSAILKKKHAMQTMLEAQKTIEDVERDVSDILDGQTLKSLRSMFFRDFSSSSDGQYLTQLERATL